MRLAELMGAKLTIWRAEYPFGAGPHISGTDRAARRSSPAALTASESWCPVSLAVARRSARLPGISLLLIMFRVPLHDWQDHWLVISDSGIGAEVVNIRMRGRTWSAARSVDTISTYRRACHV
jgi:hypothetical protein